MRALAPDCILHNGRIYTVDAQDKVVMPEDHMPQARVLATLFAGWPVFDTGLFV